MCCYCPNLQNKIVLVTREFHNTVKILNAQYIYMRSTLFAWCILGQNVTHAVSQYAYLSLSSRVLMKRHLDVKRYQVHKY